MDFIIQEEETIEVLEIADKLLKLELNQEFELKTPSETRRYKRIA